jgi:hypothetical protein
MYTSYAQQDSNTVALSARLVGNRRSPAASFLAPLVEMGIDPVRSWLVSMLEHGTSETSDSAGILLAARIRQLQILHPAQALKDPKWTKPLAPKPGPQQRVRHTCAQFILIGILTRKLGMTQGLTKL